METLTIDTRHGAMALTRSGQGEVVLLLHGVPGSAQTWRPVAERLSASATVLVPELLGFGTSAHPTDLATLHATGQADALEDVLDALDIDRVTVVGHDFGGPVGLLLATRQPTRVVRLGLLATNAFPDTPIPFPLSTLNWPLVGRLVAPVLFSRASLAAMLAMGTGRPRTRLDRRAHLGDAAQLRAIRTIFEGSLRNLADLFTPVQHALEAWRGPTFVAWGDRDPFFPLAQGERTAGAAGVELTVFPGAGHFLPQERPDDVAAAVSALLQVPAGQRA